MVVYSERWYLSHRLRLVCLQTASLFFLLLAVFCFYLATFLVFDSRFVLGFFLRLFLFFFRCFLLDVFLVVGGSFS